MQKKSTNSQAVIKQKLLKSHPEIEECEKSICAAFQAISTALENDCTLFLCGNGGSAADAEHIAGELLKGFTLRRPLDAARCAAIATAAPDLETSRYITNHLQQGLRAVSLTGHPSLSTAMANDVAADLVFAQQLNALGRKGDVLLAISTSGNSRNIMLCSTVARALGIYVVGLTGRDGGALRSLSDTLISVPADETAKVQELHMPVYHALCEMLETAFFTSS